MGDRRAVQDSVSQQGFSKPEKEEHEGTKDPGDGRVLVHPFRSRVWAGFAKSRKREGMEDMESIEKSNSN
jgi:hypothetical protein